MSCEVVFYALKTRSIGKYNQYPRNKYTRKQLGKIGWKIRLKRQKYVLSGFNPLVYRVYELLNRLDPFLKPIIKIFGNAT